MFRYTNPVTSTASSEIKMTLNLLDLCLHHCKDLFVQRLIMYEVLLEYDRS